MDTQSHLELVDLRQYSSEIIMVSSDKIISAEYLMQADQSYTKRSSPIFLKHVAIPIEHGSWVFLFSPMFIGLFAGESFSWASVLLIFAALAAFMLRQPITILVKVLSKRRPRSEVKSATTWIMVYGLIGLVSLVGLIILGYFPLLYLVVPAVPVFGWHLWLVSRRSERRQPIVEIAGSGALALIAPAAFWVGQGKYDPIGWLLFVLTWMQAAVSIFYAYLRLEQRVWKEVPSKKALWRAGRMMITAAAGSFIIVTFLSAARIIPILMPFAFLIQLGETILGTFNPAVKVRPALIGIRQLIVSTLYTIAFILAWTILS